MERGHAEMITERMGIIVRFRRYNERTVDSSAIKAFATELLPPRARGSYEISSPLAEDDALTKLEPFL